jgi:RND family efflux transporter MFP subunit
MAGKVIAGRLLGLLIGLALMAGAVYCVIFVEWKTEPEELPPPVRPLKTMVVGTPFVSSGHKYPGKVKATQSVDLAFQVDGPLIELPVIKGEEVEEGQLLARIDPRDYENTLTSATAEFNQTKANLERIERSVKTGAVSKTDLTNAKAAFEKAEATMKIAQKALDDTSLYAKFPGRIANKYVENYENVRAKQSILSLQDVSSVEIEVAVPEGRVAVAKEEERDNYRFEATFDYLPGRGFEVTLQEFETEADPLTQTYNVTFAMPSPEDLNIMPGMTVTVQEFLKTTSQAEGAAHSVPIDAVPIDGQGIYYVWKLKPSTGDCFTVHRQDVTVGEIINDNILVTAGLKEGDRIALAGVHLLQENQEVRLLKEKTGEEPK